MVLLKKTTYLGQGVSVKVFCQEKLREIFYGELYLKTKNLRVKKNVVY